LGRPTASEFKRILTPKTFQEGGPGAQSYMRELIGEVLNPVLARNAPCYMSKPMLHGTQTEPEARRFYSMERDVDVANGGFCTTDDGRLGASPDGVIGLRRLEVGDTIEGALELKCPMPTQQLLYLASPTKVPALYRWQCHGHLIVTGAAWVDFMSYCVGCKPLLVRVEPGPDTERLRVALKRFWGRYVEELAKQKP